MASQIETLLRVQLAAGADFEQKQLLKSGSLGTAAVTILEARRKRLKMLTMLIGSFLFVPVLFYLVSSLLGQDRPTNIGLLSALMVMQLPLLIEQRAAISRLETLIAVWLLSEDKQDDESPVEADVVLSQILG
jgi:hypothetical protein